MPESLAHLPELASEYPLTGEQITQFQRDGHILLRGVCSPDEVAAYRPAIASEVERLNAEKREVTQRETRYAAFLQIANLWENDEACRRFVFARRFAKIAAELMGTSGVRLYHDQALFKEPGGSITPWHQDQYYWPLDTPNTVTLWMPLVDCSLEMGALTFASGSHGHECFEKLAISDESEAVLKQLVAQRGFPIHVEPVRAGDATFHTGWTLHCAPPNRTDRMREVMTIIYHAADARVVAPDNPHRPKDLERWLPGCTPGDLAASRLNPVLYQQNA
jgi:ectoine hydroxylase-related dioxygenase (phytanoyl-CoA dioxygenase family)